MGSSGGMASRSARSWVTSSTPVAIRAARLAANWLAQSQSRILTESPPSTSSGLRCARAAEMQGVSERGHSARRAVDGGTTRDGSALLLLLFLSHSTRHRSRAARAQCS